jgi:hypothetical protein
MSTARDLRIKPLKPGWAKLEVMAEACKHYGLKPERTVMATAAVLRKFFAEKGAEHPELLSKCSTCNGESLSDYPKCPYCGDAEEAEAPPSDEVEPTADEAQDEPEAEEQEPASEPAPADPVPIAEAAEPEETPNKGKPLSEFIDLRERRASRGVGRDWFAEGAIEGTPLVLLVGPEKAGKSWILIDLVVATISGQRWLGRHEIKRPGPVIVLDAEYGPDEYTRRLDRVARGRGLDPDAIADGVRYIYSTGWELRKHPAPTAANKHATAHHDGLWALYDDLRDDRVEPALIIVDPLRNHLGGDENSAKEVLEALAALSALRGQAKCPVVIAHHLNKAGGASGSRALLGRADLIIEGSDESKPWYSASGRTIRQGDPIAQRFTVEVKHAHDQDDDKAATTLAARVVGQSGASKAELSKSTFRVLEALKSETGLTPNQLKTKLRMSYSTVRDALQELHAKGLATKTEAGEWEVSAREFFAELNADLDQDESRGTVPPSELSRSDRKQQKDGLA